MVYIYENLIAEFFKRNNTTIYYIFGGKFAPKLFQNQGFISYSKVVFSIQYEFENYFIIQFSKFYCISTFYKIPLLSIIERPIQKFDEFATTF